MNLAIGKIKKKVIIVMITILLLTPLLSVQAAMKSASYIIYENVLHTFDGPVITNVAAVAAVGGATATWTTNVLADSFVVYDTNSGFTSSKEQGTSVKNATSHSVQLVGLSEGTLYYYKVKSTRINGGVSESTASTFTTVSTPVVPPVTPPSPGGGMLIIDKTDKKPPVITDVVYKVTSSVSAEIRWTTDEKSTSFVEYGETSDYGSTFGSW
ncbi:MAG: fibronectin type III domain-containing protein, partial [Candidatus Falkowbacteria bacterium]|nr:fibronectin type III domain-containing protein [Candidatus Falkowbacteria bacterium]